MIGRELETQTDDDEDDRGEVLLVLEVLESVEETLHELVSGYFFERGLFKNPHQQNEDLGCQILQLGFDDVDRYYFREVFIGDELFLYNCG